MAWKGVSLTLPGGEKIRCLPAIADRFDDLVAVLGDKGGPGACWCMWWRLTNAAHKRTEDSRRRDAMRERFATSPPPGVFGYIDDRPIGWCAVAPRDEYPRMQASPTFGPVDDTPVWAVSCLFIHRTARRRGVGTALVDAAVRMAKASGAKAIEGIPVEPPESRNASGNFTGMPSMFEPLGFTEIARRKPERPIVRVKVR